MINRYADHFIIGIKGGLPLKQVQSQLKLFLEEKGLILSDEKTKIIKWSSNVKIDFYHGLAIILCLTVSIGLLKGKKI